MTDAERPERRLAAVLVADVAGYSRLMGQDEVGTLAKLAEHRTIFEAAAGENGGRIVNCTGDSILAEFRSVVGAVQCAQIVQERIELSNDVLPSGRQLSFRIGVHVGDVLVRDGDLFGDVINIAARLQALAEPGGVCLSAAAHEHVRKTMDAGFLQCPRSPPRTSRARSGPSCCGRELPAAPRPRGRREAARRTRTGRRSPCSHSSI